MLPFISLSHSQSSNSTVDYVCRFLMFSNLLFRVSIKFSVVFIFLIAYLICIIKSCFFVAHLVLVFSFWRFQDLYGCWYQVLWSYCVDCCFSFFLGVFMLSLILYEFKIICFCLLVVDVNCLSSHLFLYVLASFVFASTTFSSFFFFIV